MAHGPTKQSTGTSVSLPNKNTQHQTNINQTKTMTLSTLNTIRTFLVSALFFGTLASCSGTDWPDPATISNDAKKAVVEEATKKSESCLKISGFTQTSTSKGSEDVAGQSFNYYIVYFTVTVEAVQDCYRQAWDAGFKARLDETYCSFFAAKDKNSLRDPANAVFVTKGQSSDMKMKATFRMNKKKAGNWYLGAIEHAKAG